MQGKAFPNQEASQEKKALDEALPVTQLYRAILVHLILFRTRKKRGLRYTSLSKKHYYWMRLSMI